MAGVSRVSLNSSMNVSNPSLRGTQRVQEKANVSGTSNLNSTEGTEQDSTKKEEEREDLLSVSQDGDTVQASKQARQKLTDEEQGRVIPLDGKKQGNEEKPLLQATGNGRNTGVQGNVPGTNRHQEFLKETEKEDLEERFGFGIRGDGRLTPKTIRKEIREEAKEERQEERQEERLEAQMAEKTSFAGYTDQQVEQLYLQGVISKSDYDQEMGRREAQEEERTQETGERTQRFQADLNTRNNNEVVQEELTTAYEPDSNDNLEPQDRVQIIQAAQMMGGDDKQNNLNFVSTS